MNIAVEFTKHALKRLSERCFRFGINIADAEERARKTVKYGKPIKVKQKKGYSITLHYYFKEGFSFYVVCKKEKFINYALFKVKTVIIRWGRR